LENSVALKIQSQIEKSIAIEKIKYVLKNSSALEKSKHGFKKINRGILWDMRVRPQSTQFST